MSDCRNPYLSAYDRAEIEDAERSRGERITFVDTRETLVADILAWRDVPRTLPGMIPMWLDRQAAITRREVLAQPDERDEQIAELEAECDARARALDFNLKHIHELQEQVDALEAELNRTCTLAYDGKWLTCSECGESLQWFGVRTVYKTGTQERALGVEGVRYCPFCGARIEEVDA